MQGRRSQEGRGAVGPPVFREISAQAFEAVHPDFLETYQRFKVDPEHKDYGKKFKASVCNYDSFHVCDY